MIPTVLAEVFDTLAEPALWRPGGSGPAIPIAVIRRPPPQPVAGWADVAAFDFRRTEVNAPTTGDTIEVAAVVWPIAAPLAPRDPRRLLWTATCLQGAGTGPSGTRSELVTIQARVPGAPDGGGGQGADYWADVANPYAEVDSVTAGEAPAAGQLAATALRRFRIVRQAGITADARLLWRGRAFNIRSAPDPGPSALWMELIAEDGVPA